MRLDCGSLIVRDWSERDRESLVRHADNRNVWRNLKDRFPHPYANRDAEAWLTLAREHPERAGWAIDMDGEAYWGRGIMTGIVQTVSDHGLSKLGYLRLEAPVFAWNPASMRVLEKCGYVREGVMKKSVFKDGQVIDSVLYARVTG